MCQLVVKPSGENWDSTLLHQSYVANPHGVGLAFSKGKDLRVKKGLMKWKDIEKCLREVPRQSMAIVHFRLASQGEVCEANCHPFHLGKNPDGIPAVLAHNGHVPGFGTDQISDTRELTDTVIGPLWRASGIGRIPKLLGALSATSRFVILTPLTTTIINEDLGIWRNGCWYSNPYCVAPQQVTDIDWDDRMWYDWICRRGKVGI